MLWLNNLISKVGVDKVLHLLGGAWITSWFSDFGFEFAFVGVFITWGLAWIKEKYLDETLDLEDIVASVFGGIIEVMRYGLFSILL